MARILVVSLRLPNQFLPNRHLPNDRPRLNGMGHMAMILCSGRARRLRRWLLAAALLVVAVAMSGCRTLSYYSQAIKGQYQVVGCQQKIEKLLADPQTPEPLKAKLHLVHAPCPGRLRRRACTCPCRPPRQP